MAKWLKLPYPAAMPDATNAFTPLALGLALGLRHALDSDHLVAMVPIPPAVSRWFELGVAVMLVALGLQSVRRGLPRGEALRQPGRRFAGNRGFRAGLVSIAFGVFYGYRVA